MRNTILIFIFSTLLSSKINSQTIIDLSPYKIYSWDEYNIYTCQSEKLNFKNYFDPSNYNCQYNSLSDWYGILIKDEYGNEYSSYAVNQNNPILEGGADLALSFEEMFPGFSFSGTSKKFIIEVWFLTYNGCPLAHKESTGVYTNIIQIKRTFFNCPSAGSIYLDNSGISKTIEYNTTPNTIYGSNGSGGNGTFSYQWQKNENNKGWVDIINANGANLFPDNMKISTVFRRKDISGCNNVLYSNTVNISVLPDINPGQIGSSQSICYGSDVIFSNVQGASGATGSYTYQWQRSDDGNSYSDLVGESGLSYTSKNMTSTCYFRRKCTSGVNFNYSNVVLIKVRAPLTPGTIGSSQTVCYGSIPAPLTGTMPTGGDENFSYKWEYTINGSTWEEVPLAKNSNYLPSTISITTKYRRVVTSGSGCGSVVSNNITIDTYGPILVGTISKSQSICYNTTPEGFSSKPALGGGTLIGYQWKLSEDGFIWYNVQEGEKETYQPGSLTTTTYYKRQVTTTCGSRSTDSIQIEVKPEVNPGTIGQAQNICTNTIPLPLTGTSALGGFGNYLYQWQISGDNVNWADIPGETLQYFQSGKLVSSSYYRRKVTTAPCGSFNSNTILINVTEKLPTPSVYYKPVYCKGEDVTLQNTNGNLSYTWFDALHNPISNSQKYFIGNIDKSQTLYCQVIGTNGCISDQQEIDLSVDEVKADFNFSSQTTHEGEPIKFSNNSQNASAFLWDFSEGEQSTLKDPWHIFNDPGTKRVTLIATSINNCSDTLVKSGLVVLSTLGVKDQKSELFKIYPNPVTDILNINYSDLLSENEYLIYNSVAEELYAQKVKGNTSIDMSMYSSGVYILKIQTGEASYTYKIIKN